MTKATPIQLPTSPGIQRDGTQFDCDSNIDGQWVRWQNGRPRKMGGYTALSSQIPGKIYGMHQYHRQNVAYVHMGYNNGIGEISVNSDGTATIFNDRTPAGFVASDYNLWQFDVFRDTVANTFYLVAHAAPNLSCICASTTAKVWYGELTATTTALVDTGATAVDGGIVVIGPYVITFGSEGLIRWNVPNNITNWAGVGSGEAYITGQKIVYGMPLRGSGPAALLWSADSLMRLTFAGGTTVWSADTISSQTSILSSQGVIEYDGVYYWPGVDRFLMFNGVVREIPNNQSANYFFEGLNYSQRQKIFAYKVPRFGEIWWCYPRGDATEPSHAIIYNVRENSWYDTELPNGGRSAGHHVVVQPYPLMVGTALDPLSSRYILWRHEKGLDEVPPSGSAQAIRSYFSTRELSLPGMEQNASNNETSVSLMEPDLDQVGDMRMTITGRSNSRSTERSVEYTLPETPSVPQEQVLSLKETFRLVRFTFESNTLGGDYYFGKTLVHIKPAGERVVS